tara:strand:- start:360 stop:917 length:558 start_codon:yes stop_codon:yes gene_type:complete
LSDKNNLSGSSNNSYSQALYELAEENNVSKNIEEEASALLKLTLDSRDFNLLIKDPTNNQSDQMNVINLISDKYKFNELFKRFLNFLVSKRKLFFVEKILKDFLTICSNKRGEVVANLSAAKKLSSSEIEIIKNDLKENFGSNIKLDIKYDPSLIGGLVIQVGSVMIDTSIKNKLQQIQSKMLEV